MCYISSCSQVDFENYDAIIGFMQVHSVTQCRPENTHREFQPSNRSELLPKSPPFHAKVERVNGSHH